MSASTSTKRKSERIAGKCTLPAAKESKKQANARDRWLLANEKDIETAFDFLIELLSKKNADNCREEGDRTFTNFAAIVADELCPHCERIYNDDSTDDEDDVEGLGSEDDEDETETETETEEELDEAIDELLEDDDDEEEEEEEEDEDDE